MASFAMFAFIGAAKAQNNNVVTYPAPESEAVQTGFSVYANGQKVDIYKALSPQFEGGEYYFAMFDFEGTVEVKINSNRNLEKSEIFPDKFKVLSKKKNELVFSADKPFNASILHEERVMPLIIFGNPVERDIPNKDDPNVVYFGAGVHVQKKIALKSNQTLYIAGGAVVKSRIEADGDNIVVRGRGILSGELFPRFSTGNLASFKKCKNLAVRDVVFKDPSGWNFVMKDCDGVAVDNLKICGSRMLNDDAIDICNTSNVKITNTFARAQDDIIAVKGMSGKNPCENILVENCVFWTDIANTFRIGFECEAEAMRNIVCRNIDIPFYAVNYRGPEEFWAKGIIWLQAANDMPMYDIHFENIRIRSNGNDMCVLLANPRVTKHNGSKTAGKVYDCSVKNLSVVGKKGNFKGLLYFKGADAERDVKNISLENISYFGEKIDRNYKYLIDEKQFTSGISVK